jgi:hypothetical protein
MKSVFVLLGLVASVALACGGNDPVVPALGPALATADAESPQPTVDAEPAVPVELPDAAVGVPDAVSTDAVSMIGPDTSANDVPDASALPPSGRAGEGGSLCQRSCASTSRPACPRTQSPSDCVASCEVLVAGKCGVQMTAFGECLAGLTAEQVECDEAGAPRAKSGACDDSLFALARCLSMPTP